MVLHVLDGGIPLRHTHKKLMAASAQESIPVESDPDASVQHDLSNGDSDDESTSVDSVEAVIRMDEYNDEMNIIQCFENRQSVIQETDLMTVCEK